MNKKELKNLAKRLAEAEQIIQRNEDTEAADKAKNLICELSRKVTNFNDMMLLDEYIQEILAKNS